MLIGGDAAPSYIIIIIIMAPQGPIILIITTARAGATYSAERPAEAMTERRRGRRAAAAEPPTHDGIARGGIAPIAARAGERCGRIACVISLRIVRAMRIDASASAPLSVRIAYVDYAH